MKSGGSPPGGARGAHHDLWVDPDHLLQRMERRQRAQPPLQIAHRLVDVVDAPRAQHREGAARVAAGDAEGPFGVERAEAHLDEACDLVLLVRPVAP